MPFPRFLTASFAITACLAAATIGAAPAAAGPYDVEVCTPSSTEGNGVRFFDESFPKGVFEFRPCGNAIDGGIDLGTKPDVVAKSRVRWAISAPVGSKIHSVSAFRSFAAWDHDIDWAVDPGIPSSPIETVNAADTPPSASTTTFLVDASTFDAGVSCHETFCGGAGSVSTVSMTNVIAHMEDLKPPTGEVKPPPRLSGIAQLPFAAKDEGSGLREVRLLVNGKSMGSITDDNNGRCRLPYRFLNPCATEISRSFTVDTTSLPDGENTAQLEIEDATAQGTVTQPQTFQVFNGPLISVHPSISGSARVGGHLTVSPGTWSGSPAFAFEWLSCPSDVRSLNEGFRCTPIRGQTQSTYSPTLSDANQRLMVQIRATNSHGSETAFSEPSAVINPSPVDKTAPLLSAGSLARKKFHIAKKHRRGGTTLRLTSSEPATLSIVVERLTHRRKFKPSGAIHASVPMDKAKVPITGLIGKKPLAPGRYRLRITATDGAGNVSAPLVLPFQILAG